MLTTEDIMEELSHVYVHAIAAKLGYKYEKSPSPDRDSVDATIRAKGKLVNESVWESVQIDLQLKSTTNIEEFEDHYVFDLLIKNYDELRKPRTVPILLVVLFLPKEFDDWVNHTEDELISKKCAYWASLKGLEETENKFKIRVNLPKGNVFSPSNLSLIMSKLSVEGKL